MMDNLTIREAYAAMYTFLVARYQQSNSDELGAMLGGMSLLEDEGTADPAAWEEWTEAVARVRNGESDMHLRLR
jgi:hypothetical protein